MRAGCPKQRPVITRATRPRPATTEQANPPSTAAASPATPAVPLTFAVPGGIIVPRRPWPNIAREAMVLGYKVRNRRRWTAKDEADPLDDSSITEVLSEEDLKRIAKAGI